MNGSGYVFTVLIVLSVGNGVIQAHRSHEANDIGNNFRLNRTRRQDERWIWGYVDLSNPPTTSTEIPPSNAPLTEDNPCVGKPIEMPNFNMPGRRISEQKCYEYIWNIKLRESEINRTNECVKWNAAHLGPNGPYFAIGGRSADPGEFPHMGAIGWKAVVGTWIFKCGGSLISSKFVLTAAHCTKAPETDTTIADTIPKIVRFGDKNIIDKFSKGLSPIDSTIGRIIVHPDYKSPIKYNDIALLEINEEHYFDSNYQPACLWKDFDHSTLGVKATVTGWGVVEAAGRETSPDLQVIEVDLIDDNTCDSLLQQYCNRLWCGLNNTQICAGKLSGGVDACRGDSGGPLQVKIPLPPSQQGAMHYVIGVTSFGFGCAKADTPGVYTRVSEYIDWIESTVWPQ